jgi:hypothetical protein
VGVVMFDPENMPAWQFFLSLAGGLGIMVLGLVASELEVRRCACCRAFSPGRLIRDDVCVMCALRFEPRAYDPWAVPLRAMAHLVAQAVQDASAGRK